VKLEVARQRAFRSRAAKSRESVKMIETSNARADKELVMERAGLKMDHLGSLTSARHTWDIRVCNVQARGGIVNPVTSMHDANNLSGAVSVIAI